MFDSCMNGALPFTRTSISQSVGLLETLDALVAENKDYVDMMGGWTVLTLHLHCLQQVDAYQRILFEHVQHNPQVAVLPAAVAEYWDFMYRQAQGEKPGVTNGMAGRLPAEFDIELPPVVNLYVSCLLGWARTCNLVAVDESLPKRSGADYVMRSFAGELTPCHLPVLVGEVEPMRDMRKMFMVENTLY